MKEIYLFKMQHLHNPDLRCDVKSIVLNNAVVFAARCLPLALVVIPNDVCPRHTPLGSNNRNS